jgi:hypothetical protein
MMMQEDLAAQANYEASLAAFERAGDTFGRSIALSALGGLATRQRDFPAARALFEESVFLARNQCPTVTLPALAPGGRRARHQAVLRG